MKAKKIISMILIGAASLNLLAGCGSNAKNGTEDDASQTIQKEGQATSDTENSNDAQETVSGDGKTLVVYYSASGNTEEAAQYIAEVTDGELFEVEPVSPYTDADLDWTDEGSRVSVEHENENEREVELVTTAVDNWENYDTVFIGYPIWWGIAAWPVNGFVEANDFTGKTVIPFCTSASSDLGESGELLVALAGTGEWQEGKRFQSGVSKEDVQSWVSELGF